MLLRKWWHDPKSEELKEERRRAACCPSLAFGPSFKGQLLTSRVEVDCKRSHSRHETHSGPLLDPQDSIFVSFPNGESSTTFGVRDGYDSICVARVKKVVRRGEGESVDLC